VIHMRRLLLATLLSGLLGGCMLGPNYRAPTMPKGAEAPLVSVNNALEKTTEPRDDWWRLYDDPMLDKILGEAFAANTDLAAAEANLSIARAQLEASRAGRYPSTTAGAQAIRGRNATTDEILEIDGHPPQTLWTYDATLDASYEIDLFGRVRRSIEASRADAEAAAAARDSIQVTVAAETTRAYAQICTLGEQIAVARHSLDIVGQQAGITHSRGDAGAGSEFDTVRADALVAQVKSAIPSLEGQRRAAFFELAALMGRTPAQGPDEVLTCVTPPHLQALIPIGDGAGLLRRRPDVREADRRLAAATARIGVAMADLYPTISLGGLYGGIGPHVSDLTTARGLTWGLGPTISWSFPNQAIPRAHIREAKGGAAYALASFDSTVLRALKETEQTLSIYSSELNRRQDLSSAQELARRAFVLAQDQSTAGSISTLDMLTTEQSLVSADAAIAASDAALSQDQIALFKALGGGWNETVQR
jgi:NodT family efflux transporter outer membrane factor (OMF) lipoprotein